MNDHALGISHRSLISRALSRSFFARAWLIFLLFASTGSSWAAAPAPVAMPLISRGKPAFSSSGPGTIYSGPMVANDANYQSLWFSAPAPAWIAYDLSTVPVNQRQQVLVAWYAGRALGYVNDPANEFIQIPIDYTIEINPAAGGAGTAPTSGWQTVVTVTGNNRGARQHLLDLGGANWLRLRATASSNPAGIAIDLDVHSAPAGASDCWLFLGDSVTGFAAYLFSDLPSRVNTQAPGRWPVVVAGAIGGSNTGSAKDTIDEALSLYPGRYVTLNYGTNDGPTGFSAALEVLIQKVLAAGKTPVIPHMPWSDIPDQLTKAPLINAQIDALYVKYPAILRGPDLYAAFLNRTDLIPSGDVHPNGAGNDEMRRQWALAMTVTGNVPSPVVVALTPATPNMVAGGTQQFTATVSGSANTGVAWSVQEGVAGGSVSSTGLYTAPAAAGTYHVVATSTVDAGKSAVATVTVQPLQIPAGFDAAAYLARYPDLQALFGNDYPRAWIYYRDEGVYKGEVFDEQFRVEEYLALYPELFAAFGDNLGAVVVHWLTIGQIEGRLGRIPTEFSATGYFSRNPDVAAAVNNDVILAWQHYWLYGIYEGRAYDDEFRVFEYLALNSDLQAAFLANDWRGATLHWMRYGRTEGRLGRIPLIYNSAEYLARYPDVAAVWGTYPTTVWLHFWQFGIDEGRNFDEEFRVEEYLALNTDIASLYGTNRRGAFTHWVRYGRAENRRGRFAPVARNLVVAPITTNSAVLNWNTTTAAICSLEFGTTASLGQTTPAGSSYATSHQATLTGLLPDTVYYYRVLSRNAANQQSTGSTATFRTRAVVTQPPAITSFSATPAAITTGNSSALSWTVNGADSLSISSGVGVVSGTSVAVSPTVTTTYTLTATNVIGSSTQSVTVTVAPVTPPTPVIASFSATPSTIAAGNASTLNWSVTGASSLSITPGVGAVTGTSTTVSPTTTTTYTLTATSGATSVMQSATVTVVPVASSAPVINSFTVDSASLSTTGMCTLVWDVTGTANLSISPSVGIVSGNSISISPLATTIYTLTATNSAGTVSATANVTLSTPALTLEKAPVVKIRRDDHVATVEMDFDPGVGWGSQLWSVGTDGRDGCGYRVQWWPEDASTALILSTDGCSTAPGSTASGSPVIITAAARQLVTPNRAVQIQPIANNLSYRVRVERLNGLGQVCSAPTEVTFNGGDPARVAALRSSLTFFDDFNLVMGAPDERKWNNAAGPQTDPRLNLFFINDQLHVHTLNGTRNDGAGDRSQVAQRPRKPIAIENGVRRRIVFDMDGIFSPRSVWYLDLNPVKTDLTGHMSFFDMDGDKGLPADVCRLRANGDGISVNLIDSTGASLKIAEANLADFGRRMGPNVRRAFDVRVGTDGIQIFVDGTSVLNASFPAGAFKPGTYDLLWSTIGYNTSKDNNPFFLSHWDNFGFDGPDLEPRAVHNYVTRIAGSDMQKAQDNQHPTFTIKVPDDIRPTAPGATSEVWLVFGYLKNDFSSFYLKPGDYFLFNGRSIPLPAAGNNTSPLDPTAVDYAGSYISNRVKIGEVAQGGTSPLKIGDNTIQFFAANTGIMNLHLEVICPENAKPPYTPPCDIHPVPMHADLPKLGPPARFVFIDGKELSEDENGDMHGPTIAGKTKLEVLVGNGNWANWAPQWLNFPATSQEIWSTGGTAGIKSVELFLRRKGTGTGRGDRIAVLTTSRDAPAPQVRYVFDFDTRRYPNGEYEIFVEATTLTGVKSHPEYSYGAFRWDASEWSGAYEPVAITIAN